MLKSLHYALAFAPLCVGRCSTMRFLMPLRVMPVASVFVCWNISHFIMSFSCSSITISS